MQDTVDVWETQCRSEYQRNVGPNLDLPAKYYTFEMLENAFAFIELHSVSSRLNPFLVLRHGSIADGNTVVLARNDNNPRSSAGDARLSYKLSRGHKYTIEATLAAAPLTGSAAGEFRLEMTLMPIGFEVWPAVELKVGLVILEFGPTMLEFGHQQDHTVAYRINIPTATPTPTPTPLPAHHTPVPTPTPIGDTLPYIGVRVATAVPVAAQTWNHAVATPWPHVVICEEGSILDVSAKVGCDDRNTDGKIIIIEVGKGVKTQYQGDLTGLDGYLFGNDCGKGVACVKPYPMEVQNLSYLFGNLGDGHLKDLQILIEQPAYGFSKKKGVPPSHPRCVWTNNPLKHGASTIEGGENGTFCHLPAMMMHEFGHTFGLADLYEYPNRYTGYLMDDYNVAVAPTPTIPILDIEYVYGIYDIEHSAGPH